MQFKRFEQFIVFALWPHIVIPSRPRSWDCIGIEFVSVLWHRSISLANLVTEMISDLYPASKGGQFLSFSIAYFHRTFPGHTLTHTLSYLLAYKYSYCHAATELSFINLVDSRFLFNSLSPFK